MITHSKPWITEADQQAVVTVLSSGMIAQGQLVHQLETKVAHYLDVAGGVAVASGSSALVLALTALGVNNDDEVILPTYVCKSVMESVIGVGAKPVLCDIGHDGNMTQETIAAQVTSKTAVIIVVHIFGVAANTHALKCFGIPIIEDCCQAFGTSINGAKVGSIGTIGIFSFHATKCLTTGEGGMAVSNSSNLLEKMRSLRDGDSFSVKERITAPLTDLQAALGLSQLSRYSNFLQRRQEIANYYLHHLHNCSLELPAAINQISIFFRFPVRVNGNFETYQQQFHHHNIQVRRGVDNLLHRLLGLEPHQFPTAERLFAETVSLPIYPALSNAELQQVVLACHTIWSNQREY
ncbi:DegT/DnrJ/EryC1/StrS family aminotransferase [Nostoc sp. LEGE 06077]|uniref:DegT/DnrJ/EryC1/StrS family aminotransferase n=1 Tax=Nostoc sp. LEGE 06077 TaxID=915325 RepID=UPI00187E6783|nr:DegT/DnrJ/EryC1/StrS family aminotransferase [Nostoc sp. LEGE 06077]MBE9207147.1 DegT/DnrJ/EryC1/StrS family aminotransferase [Nostoc sp. LEGE 06077]